MGKKEEKTAKSVFPTCLVKHDILSKKHTAISIMQQMLILRIRDIQCKSIRKLDKQLLS